MVQTHTFISNTVHVLKGINTSQAYQILITNSQLPKHIYVIKYNDNIANS